MCVCSGEMLQIRDLEHRVGRRFRPDEARLRTKRCLNGVRVGEVDEGGRKAPIGHDRCEQAADAVVGVVCQKHVIAGPERLEDGGGGGHARGERHADSPAFHVREHAFEVVARRIADPAVDIAGREGAVCGALKRGGEVQRRDNGSGERVGCASCVGEPGFDVGHEAGGEKEGMYDNAGA